MIVIYKRLSVKEIRKTAKAAIADVSRWFTKNPKRRICRVEGWYGKLIRVRRNHVEQDINAAADAAIGSK